MEIQSPAREAWAIYGSVGLTVITVPKYLAAVDIVEGDGGEGTIAKLTLLSGSSYYEKFTKVDDKHMVKETEITEGAFLDLGITLYRLRVENIPTGSHSCITRTTIEWEVKEEYVANSTRVSILPSINIAKDIEAYLLANEKKHIDSK
ncbi:hypothetical protein RJ640_026072 [Escallonia rubra]|uniref:Bet v I/Major latex protein domain-containing protein n=1 Tax=Escallonia rubra TaxID=112253 RepID=A0AA88RXI7_9ASTE|nr:hypothetical protein RJ640_026072 [Escallonia rubra]